jgi:FMN-dependent NADH-azoreductase
MMPFLLHIDSSIRKTGSVSRELTSYFAELWRQHHPGAGYKYRDLAEEPVPHITHTVQQALIDPSGGHAVSQAEQALTEELAGELRAATTILLGVPMYNLSVPSTVKAWMDRIVTPAHMTTPDGTPGILSGKSVVVVATRGGSAKLGAASGERGDYHESYLRTILGLIGLEEKFEFVPAELTMTRSAPQMESLKPMAESSLSSAYETLRNLAGQAGFRAALQ